MHYLGSKARHAAAIIEFTQSKRKTGQTYVEPFVGGGNMMCRVPADLGPRIGNDFNFHMVQLLDQLGNHGWVPPETMNEQQWSVIAHGPEPKEVGPEAALYAFAATGPTFGSVWFGAWANDYEGKEGTRYRQARDAALKDQPGLVGVTFYHRLNNGGDFRNLTKHNIIPPESVIYCDPPYLGTTGYDGAKETILVGEGDKNTWKGAAFWAWADSLVEAGHTVYVSEYSGPAPSVYASSGQSEALKAALAEAKARVPERSMNKRQKDEWRAAGGQRASDETIAEVDGKVRAATEAQAAESVRLSKRWESVWHKEVTSDFSASRGKDEDGEGGKKETEHLFHRAA